MKRILMFVVVVLLAAPYSVQAEDEVADSPPDPVPGATKPVREQNLDANEWIAVHEQGTANVEVQNDETNPIPVDVQGTVEATIEGGSIEAEITGGEVEVTNEVTVRIADGEVVIVKDGNRTYNHSFWLDDSYGWFGQSRYTSPAKFTSLVCEATSDYPDINSSLNVKIYSSVHGAVEYADFEDMTIFDVCAPFSKGYGDGSLAPTYHYYCKSNSEWNITASDFQNRYVYAVRGGNIFAPITRIRCMLAGVRYDLD